MKTRTRRFILWSAITLAAGANWLQSRSALTLPAAPLSARESQQSAPITAQTNQQTATFAGGCFWSMEAIFKQLRGVSSVEPGYAGGQTKNPTYQSVLSGTTGHAETVNIIFDPQVISYRELLKVFFAVHNPTTANRQGNDVGPQYRSLIITRDATQQREAQRALKAAASTWGAPIVTQVLSFSNFTRAEAYHLDYYQRHPLQSYCFLVVRPEIAAFRAQFASKLKS